MIVAPWGRGDNRYGIFPRVVNKLLELRNLWEVFTALSHPDAKAICYNISCLEAEEKGKIKNHKGESEKYETWNESLSSEIELQWLLLLTSSFHLKRFWFLSLSLNVSGEWFLAKWDEIKLNIEMFRTNGIKLKLSW